MNWSKAKTVADIALDGIAFEVEIHDKAIKTVTLTDKNGNKVRFFQPSQYESLSVLVPSPPQTVEKFKVAGSICDGKVLVEKTFDQRYEAEQYKTEIGYSRDSALEITPVTIEESVPF